MSITNRLIDAALLYDAGRYEGSLLSVLVAAGGTSRKRFPRGTISRRDPSKQMTDAEAFETFVGEEMQRIGACSVMFGGQCNAAERIFYKWLRCSLAHEAELPEHVAFEAGSSPCVASIHRDAGPPERLIITYPIVLLIGHVVATATENVDVPEDVKRSLAPRGIIRTA